MSYQNLNTNLNEVWRTCRKIQSAIFKHGFNISNELQQYDPNGNGLLPESKFSSVLGKYKKTIGLSDFEIRELTDYFRIRDGRVAYKQFLSVICESEHDHVKNVDNVHGLEWNDPMHVNTIHDHEKRKLCILLMKIAKLCTLPLMPYFQDYELVARNIGNVTIAHFSRVLHFMKIVLSENDFMLLLKRYMKDSFTVNYVAFVTHVDAIRKYLKEQGLMDSSNDIIQFPGQIVDIELPELPFPNADGINKYASVFEKHEKSYSVCNAVFRIQRYVYENRIRISEFMETFDLLRTGSITSNQFLRALDNAGISGLKRMKLNQRETEMICGKYADPIDRNRVKWRDFVDEIDRGIVFTEKNLDKQPQLVVDSPLKYIKTLPEQGQIKWQEVVEDERDLCEEAILKMQKKINTRRIYLHPFFKSFDKLNRGYVTPKQAYQALLSNTLFVSEEEFDALQKRYGNDMGFNYMRFMENVDPAEYAIPKLIEPTLPNIVFTSKKNPSNERGGTEQDVINVLAEVKKQANVTNVNIIDFLVDYDRHKRNYIHEMDFRRGLDNSNIKLKVSDVDIICDAFRSHNHGCAVRYRDFCQTLDQIFVPKESMENEISVPLKHFPCVDCLQCFLNFEERTVASKALQKLATKPDQISNLQSLFKDFDKENCGTITQNQFLRVLSVREMSNMISSREFEVVCKCFGSERGRRIEFDYRRFIDVLNILHETGQVAKNY